MWTLTLQEVHSPAVGVALGQLLQAVEQLAVVPDTDDVPVTAIRACKVHLKCEVCRVKELERHVIQSPQPDSPDQRKIGKICK